MIIHYQDSDEKRIFDHKAKESEVTICDDDNIPIVKLEILPELKKSYMLVYDHTRVNVHPAPWMKDCAKEPGVKG